MEHRSKGKRRCLNTPALAFGGISWYFIPGSLLPVLVITLAALTVPTASRITVVCLPAVNVNGISAADLIVRGSWSTIRKRSY